MTLYNFVYLFPDVLAHTTPGANTRISSFNRNSGSKEKEEMAYKTKEKAEK